jgi:UDP-3-O-[3-hydroxymyristoyl] glucosamine N-acyltransferase
MDARVEGDAECRITHIATLAAAGEGDIAFFSDPKLRCLLEDTGASAVIVSETNLDAVRTNALVTDNPHVAYAQVAAWLYPEPVCEPGIHPCAVVADDSQVHAEARIGAQCVIESGAVVHAGCDIGPGCVIGRGVEVGEDSRLVANVTLGYGTVLGRRVILHPGVVLGTDGFGLANDKGRWLKVPQLGRVIIGNDVEIGANTTVDRGAIEDTIIGDGVKLDNLIQVAHNVRIGAHTVIAGCTGIAGSAVIGKHCAIGGGVGIVGHLEITDNVTVTGMSLVSQSITAPGVYSSSGTPLEENAKWRRNYARLKQLDDMARRLKHIEKRLAQEDNG